MVTTTSNAFTTSDPASIRRQLDTVLRSSNDPLIRNTWARALKIGTAERLLDTFVRAVEMTLYAIDRSREERHLDTAILESSIRTVLRDLEVRMMRKISAGINVYISRDTTTAVSLTVPAFSVWTGGGRQFYNRYPIKFEVGQTTVQARLYVGTIKMESFTSDGSDFQVWLSPEDKFVVSDGRESRDGIEYSDMRVFVSGVPVSVTDFDQWWDMRSADNKAVKDRTTIDGRCELVFGDSTYGYKPVAGSIVNIRYVLTNGSEDNAANFTSNILLSGSTSITAFPIATSEGNNIVTSKIDGGANQISADVYRKTGPLLFASAGMAIRSKSAMAWALNYPGIADALVLGQSKTKPNDRRYNNVLYACLLKGGEGISQDDYVASNAEAAGWLQHFNRRRPSVNGYVVFYTPVPSSPPISLVLECESYVDLALAELSATEAVKDRFKYTPNTLRGTILLSELFDVVKYSTKGIIGVRSLTIQNDLVSYSRAPTLNLSAETLASPALPNGEYVFFVLALCTVYDGSTATLERSAPSNAVVVNSNGTTNPTLSFNPVVGGEQYEIYCRTPGSEQYRRVAVLDRDTYSFTMTSTTPISTVQMPTEQELKFRFPKLGSLTIQAVYTNSEW